MSTTKLQLPPLVTSITINGNVLNADGAGQITVSSADVATVTRQSVGMRVPAIVIGIAAPPIDPTT